MKVTAIIILFLTILRDFQDFSQIATPYVLLKLTTDTDCKSIFADWNATEFRRFEPIVKFNEAIFGKIITK